MRFENENQIVVSSIDELAERLYPSDPERIYQHLNSDLVERAKRMNSLVEKERDLRSLGLSWLAEEIEAQIKEFAETGIIST